MKLLQSHFNQFLGHILCLSFTFRQVLFISEYKNDGVPHLPVIDDPVQLLPRLVDPVPVGAVHHEYQALGPRVVVAP